MCFSALMQLKTTPTTNISDTAFILFDNYSKTCVKLPFKIEKTNILMTNGSLMKVESISEYTFNTFDLH